MRKLSHHLLALGLILGTLGAFGLTPLAWACPDFSGKYMIIWEGPKVLLSVSQKACSQLTLTYDYGGGANQIRNFYFDGKKHNIVDTPDQKSNELYNWNGERITIFGESLFPKQHVTTTYQGVLFRQPSGDLTEETTSFNAEGEPILHHLATYQKQ